LLHAKTIATLDHLSDGRLEVALGSGWLKEEFDALGADFTRRGTATDESIEAMQRLWTGEPVAFHGETVAFEAVQCLPRPAQLPHPPLWIGGSGPRAFKRMERFGAGWLGPDLPVDEFLRKLDVLKAKRTTPPAVSAKLWVEPPGERVDGALSISPEPPTNFALLAALHQAGTTDIRLDLSRVPSAERPQQIHSLARALRKARELDG
jgi:hypothetical protein